MRENYEKRGKTWAVRVMSCDKKYHFLATGFVSLYHLSNSSNRGLN